MPNTTLQIGDSAGKEYQQYGTKLGLCKKSPTNNNVNDHVAVAPKVLYTILKNMYLPLFHRKMPKKRANCALARKNTLAVTYPSTNNKTRILAQSEIPQEIVATISHTRQATVLMLTRKQKALKRKCRKITENH